MEKKDSYIYMRVNSEQKKLLRDHAEKKCMNISQYIWHLFTNDMKDKEKNKNGNNN